MKGNALTGAIAQTFGKFEGVAIIKTMQLHDSFEVLLIDLKR